MTTLWGTERRCDMQITSTAKNGKLGTWYCECSGFIPQTFELLSLAEKFIRFARRPDPFAAMFGGAAAGQPPKKARRRRDDGIWSGIVGPPAPKVGRGGVLQPCFIILIGAPKVGIWGLRIHSLRTCISLTTAPPSSGVVHIGHEVGHQLKLRICCSQNMSRWILGPKTLSKTIQEGKDPTEVGVDFLCPLGYISYISCLYGCGSELLTCVFLQ